MGGTNLSAVSRQGLGTGGRRKAREGERILCASDPKGSIDKSEGAKLKSNSAPHAGEPPGKGLGQNQRSYQMGKERNCLKGEINPDT